MARTKLVPKKTRPQPVDFTSIRVAATKEIARGRKVHPKNVKIKKLLPQTKQIEVKKKWAGSQAYDSSQKNNISADKGESSPYILNKSC